MASSQFAKGSTVFVPDEQEAYLPARVASCQGFGATAILRVTPAQGGGPERVVPAEELPLVSDADPLSLEGANDLVKYTQLTDAAVLHGLRARYARDDIYTCAGSILVSVNPFKQVPSYGDALMARCKAAGAKELHEMPPHVFVVAESAFRGMLSEGKQQAILISGESGAGKTEAAKYCLRYIVARCGVAARDAGGTSGRSDFVEQCLMQANPVLEAFGNAKTVRNGNSSRFGKWTEIQLDASGFIAASRITSYLLEKSRVAEHAQGERNYHVLYQLCAATSAPAERAALQLLPGASFRYLGESARVQLPGVDDAADWRVTSAALHGFVTSTDEMAAVRRILAAVLHLGNVHFAPVKLAQQDDGSAADAASAPRLESAAALLGLDTSALEGALTVKSVGKFPVVQVPQPPAKAAAARDALAKATYGALFGWVLARINGMMAAPASFVWDAKRTIGLLDIFGFESFARNSLEQFLINYANEKLQQFFNEYIFRMEEAECRAEGVECPVLEFADNTAVATLLEARPHGLLSLINEEVLVPNASDANLLQKMSQQHKENDAYKPLPRAQGEGFSVSHFAGPVGYHIDGFVEKNRDALPGELALLLTKSVCPLLATLFGAGEGGGGGGEGGGGGAGGGGSGGGGGVVMSSGGVVRQADKRPRRGGGGGKKAVGAVFKESLDSLLRMLHATSPHFIRCVKPNFRQAAGAFDGAYVLQQLQMMGMIHVVHARKLGYAHRYPFDRFRARYDYLWQGLERPSDAACAPYFRRNLGASECFTEGERKECATLLAAMALGGHLDEHGWAVGTSKVLLKATQQQQLEVARESHLRRMVEAQLDAALVELTIGALEQALGAAREVQLQSPKVARAEAALARLHSQHAAEAQLEVAVAKRDATALRSALEAAAAGGVPAGSAVRLQAETLLATLLGQEKAAVELASALKQNEEGALATALERAARTGLNTGLVQEAQRRLDGLRRASDLEAQLEAAAGPQPAGAPLLPQLQLLAKLLAEADGVARLDPAVQRARRTQLALQDASQLVSQLNEHSANSNRAELKKLLPRAAVAAVQPAELQAARAVAERRLEELDAAAAKAEAQAAAAKAEAEAQVHGQLIARLREHTRAGNVAELRALLPRAFACSAQTVELRAARAEAERRIGEIDAEMGPAPTAKQLSMLEQLRALHGREEVEQRRAAEQSAALVEPFAAAAAAGMLGQELAQQAQEPWVSAAGGGGGGEEVVCTPLAERLRELQGGVELIKVAEGTFTRNRYAPKHVRLDAEGRYLTWDGGKKGVDLQAVLRISVGLETRTLHKLYSGGGEPPEFRPYHWFSLHTEARSFDFGVRDCGDNNALLLLWVTTLQQLLHTHGAPAVQQPGACSALSRAQQQWQRYPSDAKEWACLACTFLNPGNPNGAAATCGTCGAARPAVTLCPCLMPLLPLLQALGNSIGVRAFQSFDSDAHLQWFLVQVLEEALPPGRVWAVRCQPSCRDLPFLGLSEAGGASFTADHAHLRAAEQAAVALRAQLAVQGAAGGAVPPPREMYMSPEYSGLARQSSCFERAGSSFQRSAASFPPQGSRASSFPPGPGSWGNHFEEQQRERQEAAAAAAAAAGGVYAAGLGGEYAEALAAAQAHERRQSEGGRGSAAHRAVHGDDPAHRAWQAARDDSDLAAAMAASLQDQGGPHAAGAAASSSAMHSAGTSSTSSADAARSDATLDASDVFRYCLSGAVAEVRKFLVHGGHVDTVYKSAYGWDVGADYAHARPNDGATPLNYVATWTDVIGPPDAAALAALLLEHGADLRRDDGLDQWFTPLHNATERGAKDVVQVMLRAQPAAVDITTGDGRTPLLVLALCEDAADRMATLEVLLAHKANLHFAEPFGGNTPLHAFAAEGFAEEVERLLQAGAPTSALNESQRTPQQEAMHALQQLDSQAGASGTRRDGLEFTIALLSSV